MIYSAKELYSMVDGVAGGCEAGWGRLLTAAIGWNRPEADVWTRTFRVGKSTLIGQCAGRSAATKNKGSAHFRERYLHQLPANQAFLSA
jgi:hypothetical protein